MSAIYRGIEIPANDAERVAALRGYDVLDTPPEQEFDDITRLAAQITGCPVAYVALFDETRSWLKSSYGLPKDRPPRPRELSLCSPTICQSDLLVVPDLAAHPRDRDLPAVQNPPHAKFYCAMPLINPEGYALGTLCVWDPRERSLTPDQLDAVRRLARLVMEKLEARRARAEAVRRDAAGASAVGHAEARAQAAESVVEQLFPGQFVPGLLRGERPSPRFHDAVSVIFIDFVGFSRLCEMHEPRAVIEQLDAYFRMFDAIVGDFGLEKIKTMGDAYLAVAGLPEPTPDHAVRTCAAAFLISARMRQANAERRRLGLSEWAVRIGVHSGQAIAGVVGETRFRYDVWGDGVNTAKRVEEAARPGCVTISEATYALVARYFETEALGEIEAKNKDPIPMHRLVAPKLAADEVAA